MIWFRARRPVDGIGLVWAVVLIVMAVSLSGCAGEPTSNGRDSESSAGSGSSETPPGAEDEEALDLVVEVVGPGPSGAPLKGVQVEITSDQEGTETYKTDGQGRVHLELGRGQFFHANLSHPDWTDLHGPEIGIDMDPTAANVIGGIFCFLTLGLACAGGWHNLDGEGATLRFAMAPESLVVPEWSAAVDLRLEPFAEGEWVPVQLVLDDNPDLAAFLTPYVEEIHVEMVWVNGATAAAALELAVGCNEEDWSEATGDDSFALPQIGDESRSLWWKPNQTTSTWLFFSESGPCDAIFMGPIVRSSTGQFDVGGAVEVTFGPRPQMPDIILHDDERG